MSVSAKPPNWSLIKEDLFVRQKMFVRLIGFIVVRNLFFIIPITLFVFFSYNVLFYLSMIVILCFLIALTLLLIYVKYKLMWSWHPLYF